MRQQALELAKIFDEQAEFGFELVLRADGDSELSKLLTSHHVRFAKEHQVNAQLLRDLVAKIDHLQAENDRLNLELGNEINIEEWAKAQRVVKGD